MLEPSSNYCSKTVKQYYKVMKKRPVILSGGFLRTSVWINEENRCASVVHSFLTRM